MPEIIFWALFLGVAASLVYKLIKNRGFAGAMLGAPVKGVIGEMTPQFNPSSLIKTNLKVVELDVKPGEAGPQVGLELRHSSIASWQMTAASLTAGEARQLAELLKLAANKFEH